VQFNEYLKSCREAHTLTQEGLVNALYNYNIDTFRGLDSAGLSKWERGVTKPRLAKQVSIIKYFQSISHTALPCWENYSIEYTEELICKVGMKNLLGKSKELILNFPEKMIGADDLKVIQLRNSDKIDKIIDINIDLDQGFNGRFTELLPEHFKQWAIHPSNSFFICEYKDEFFGLLFALRVKPLAFEKLMRFEIKEKDLTLEDLASYDEMGCIYLISFFAMNEKSATMLFIRYYAHLIANQKTIDQVGVATMMDDGKKLLSNMNLKKHSHITWENNLILQTYYETLENFLATEYTVKMILDKQDCPED